MKKKKIILTTITILVTVWGILAFREHKDTGPYFCQKSEGPCTNTTIKYKISFWGRLLYCNNGAGSTICNNQFRVKEID